MIKERVIKTDCDWCLPDLPDVLLLHSVFVKYVNRSRGDVTQLESHCSAA